MLNKIKKAVRFSKAYRAYPKDINKKNKEEHKKEYRKDKKNKLLTCLPIDDANIKEVNL